MELFFANIINGQTASLGADETTHCVKVLRNKPGDIITITDGKGSLYSAEIISAGREALLKITDVLGDPAPRPYYLHMAVSLVKNPERYEWFIEKAVETGIDEITPIYGDLSQKRNFKQERGERIIMSAVKQSLKPLLPVLNPLVSAKELIKQYSSESNYLKIIGHCREGEKEALPSILKNRAATNAKILIMIGPEGDFSPEEIQYAIDNGFIPMHMGNSRLRTETAALTATTAVYLNFLQ